VAQYCLSLKFVIQGKKIHAFIIIKFLNEYGCVAVKSALGSGGWKASHLAALRTAMEIIHFKTW
jgi:hypothetical protein